MIFETIKTIIIWLLFTAAGGFAIYKMLLTEKKKLLKIGEKWKSYPRLKAEEADFGVVLIVAVPLLSLKHMGTKDVALCATVW